MDAFQDSGQGRRGESRCERQRAACRVGGMCWGAGGVLPGGFRKGPVSGAGPERVGRKS